MWSLSDLNYSVIPAKAGIHSKIVSSEGRILNFTF